MAQWVWVEKVVQCSRVGAVVQRSRAEAVTRRSLAEAAQREEWCPSARRSRYAKRHRARQQAAPRVRRCRVKNAPRWPLPKRAAPLRSRPPGQGAARRPRGAACGGAFERGRGCVPRPLFARHLDAEQAAARRPRAAREAAQHPRAAPLRSARRPRPPPPRRATRPHQHAQDTSTLKEAENAFSSKGTNDDCAPMRRRRRRPPPNLKCWLQ